ncbi:hypothetical protein LCL97_10305 [Seohaeicola saemankumensis]|nr:hypothetical protein [Seohaeicola saemankumensis]MCA0871221.1 hypothetical protein [Seohaeicola saemankumensis]
MLFLRNSGAGVITIDPSGAETVNGAATWDVNDGQSRLLVCTGSGWITDGRPDLDNLDGIGIGTASDATNRLAVAAAATLLTHSGADHLLKIDKAATGDTAAVQFQTAGSGRAEIGTGGTDHLAFRVSDDGAAWQTALSIDPQTGVPDLPLGASAATLALGAGTPASPSVTFADNLDTGLFLAAAGTVGVAIGGSEAARWSATGYLGLGTLNPAKLLDVNGEAIIRATLSVSNANGGTMTLADTTNGGYAQIGSYNGRLVFRADQGNSETNTTITFLMDSFEIARFATGGSFGLGTSAPTALLDVAGDTIRLRDKRTVAASNEAGNEGDVCWDDDFIYVCVAANTWKRAALTSW